MLVSLKEAFFSGVDSCRLSHRCLGLLFPPLLGGHGGGEGDEGSRFVPGGGGLLPSSAGMPRISVVELS